MTKIPKLVARVPKYAKHKRSGQAVEVAWVSGGSTYCLGPSGSEKSVRKYDRIIAEYLVQGRCLLRPTCPEQIARHLLWQKEAMVNLGLGLLPPSIEYVAWVDHDILIDDPDGPAASVDLISDHPISVQPWGRMHYLDRIGRTIGQAESASAIAKSGRYPSTGPGAAWVARRSDLEEIGGIYDRNIVGGGDLVWFHALSGMRVDFLKRQSPAVRAHQEA